MDLGVYYGKETIRLLTSTHQMSLIQSALESGLWQEPWFMAAEVNSDDFTFQTVRLLILMLLAHKAFSDSPLPSLISHLELQVNRSSAISGHCQALVAVVSTILKGGRW